MNVHCCKKTAGFLIPLVLVFFFGIGPCQAEEAGGNAVEPDSVEVDTILPMTYYKGEITVTAHKQEENIQDVSASITVLDHTEIENRIIESVAEMVDYSPNMMSFDVGVLSNNQITVRGMSSGSLTRTSTAGLFVDGVPTLGAFGYEEGIVDIERIEFLRGPQGTLYGKNTEAGAINIVTRQPDNNFKGNVLLEGGSLLSTESGEWLTGGAALSLSGPIMKDKLFYSLAGKYSHKDGFIENILTGESEYELDKLFGRAKVRWTPMQGLELRFLASYYNLDQDGQNQTLAPAGAAAFGLPALPYRKVSSDFDSFQDVDIDTQSLTALYDINDEIRFTSITTRKYSLLEGALDLDFSPARLMHGIQKAESEKIAQELRLDASSDTFNWLIGFYYDKDDTGQDQRIESDIPVMNRLLMTERKGEAYAVFGQAGYFLTPKFKVIGGLRYESQELEFTSNIFADTRDSSWQNISPKIAMEYHVTPDIMTYMDISHGYRMGGFNGQAMDPLYYTYDEETLWSYEIGLKSISMDQRLHLNAAVFYMDINDMQVMEALDPYVGYITNAAEATAYGAELEITAKITGSLTLNGGIGYTNAEFDKFSDANGDYSGNKNPFAPEYSFNIGAQYRQPSGFYARADVIGYGKMYLDKENEYPKDAYILVNAKIGYETERFDTYLYGKNIFDKKHDSLGFYAGSYDIYASPGEAGLQVCYRF